MNGPEVLVPIGFFFMVISIVVGFPIAKAYARRMDRGGKTPQLPMADVIARLERIEQGVEAVSIEVERISEGQRFTTTLLAERKTAALPPGPAAPASPSESAPTENLSGPGANPAEGTVLMPAARRTT